MNTFIEHAEFTAWMKDLRDFRAKARIVQRIQSASFGNFGDTDSVGEGVMEMRIDFGPGYRVYYTRRDGVVYLLLCGGDKATQKADIKQAKKLAKSDRSAK